MTIIRLGQRALAALLVVVAELAKSLGTRLGVKAQDSLGSRSAKPVNRANSQNRGVISSPSICRRPQAFFFHRFATSVCKSTIIESNDLGWQNGLLPTFR